MSLFKALFFFACYRGLFTESLHPQINNTKSSVRSVNVSDAEPNPGYNSTGNRTEYIEKPKRNLSSSEDHNSSATNPVVFSTDSGCKEANENKSEHLRPTEGQKNVVCNISSVDLEFPAADFAFFSKEFGSRLEKWAEKLSNASKHCSKLDKCVRKYVQVDFPVFKATVDRENEFLSFASIHPALVRDTSKKDLVRIAYLAILELWPLLLLCFSCAALSGIIVWVLDSRANSEQFPRRFWRGICDGMWWAVVTMTTVGYGDKSPKSCFARLFATVWMVAGIVLLSMFTAQVSSRLTAQELKSDDHLVDKKIGVPRVLDGSDYVDDTMGFTVVEAIDAPNMSAEKLTEMKLDSILVFHCDDKIKDDKIWDVLQFMAPLHIGAEFYYAPRDGEPMEFDTEEKYIKCIKKTINAKCRKKNPGNKSRNSRSGHSCNKLNKEKLKFEFKWVYFKDLPQYLIPFGTMIGLIILCFIVGTVWDCCCQRRKNKFKSSDPEASQTGLILGKSRKEEERMLNNEVTSC